MADRKSTSIVTWDGTLRDAASASNVTAKAALPLNCSVCDAQVKMWYMCNIRVLKPMRMLWLTNWYG